MASRKNPWDVIQLPMPGIRLIPDADRVHHAFCYHEADGAVNGRANPDRASCPHPDCVLKDVMES